MLAMMSCVLSEPSLEVGLGFAAADSDQKVSLVSSQSYNISNICSRICQ